MCVCLLHEGAAYIKNMMSSKILELFGFFFLSLYEPCYVDQSSIVKQSKYNVEVDGQRVLYSFLDDLYLNLI